MLRGAAQNVRAEHLEPAAGNRARYCSDNRVRSRLRHASIALTLTLRTAEPSDLPAIWALSVLPNVGQTADPSAPFPLPPASSMPAEAFSDLADPDQSFTALGGELLVAELDGNIAAMGGFRPAAGISGRAEMLRVRVHPARRRVGLGSALMKRLEVDAAGRGYSQAWLDTATNQPDAIAFYTSIGYREIGRETRPGWTWTLVYFLKDLLR